MNSKMMAAGLALVFVAMALPSNAYHIVHAGATAGVDDNYTWVAPAPGVINGCEQNADAPFPSQAGVNGLCFISVGCTNSGGVASMTVSQSNGEYNDYDGGACKSAATGQSVIQNVARRWIEVTMPGKSPDPAATTVDQSFSGQIGIWFCGFGTEFVYDEQFAHMMDSGHVSAFLDPATVVPGTIGTYTVAAGSTAGLTACDGPAPLYSNAV